MSKVLLTRFLVFSIIIRDLALLQKILLLVFSFIILCYRAMRHAGSDGDGGLNVMTTLAVPAATVATVVIVVKKSSSELEEISKEIWVNFRASSAFTY